MNGPSGILATIIALIMALLVIFVRLRASRKPTSIPKIIMPPVGMSTGFLMFLFPMMHIPWLWALYAFLIGAVLFSYPLILTSRFEIVAGEIYLKRSRSFVFILLGLLIIRMLLHGYVEEYISVEQTGAVFFILAFGMILPWRTAMYWRYRQLHMRRQTGDSGDPALGRVLEKR